MAAEIATLREILSQGLAPMIPPLSSSQIDLFADYYRFVLNWTPLLHLTTLLSPREFAIRHIAESLLAEQSLIPDPSQLWDIGSGAGIPGIPIAIMRPDLSVRLIEANKRKAIFLCEAADLLALSRIEVVNSRFESLAPPPTNSCLVARAAERMEDLSAEIIRRGGAAAQILLFGTSNLRNRLEPLIESGWSLDSILLPGSNSSYLFDLRPLS